MPRQGLNRDAVVRAAANLIEEKGPAAFSMAALAKFLHVRTASLYNHVDSLQDLYTQVGLLAIRQMVDAEEQAISGKYREDALTALAEAYRAFARDHYRLYRMILAAPKQENPVLEEASFAIVRPIHQVLEEFGVRGAQAVHWQRLLRSFMHGFAAHEIAGGFSHVPLGRDESYRIALEWIAAGLRAAAEEGNHACQNNGSYR